MRLHEVLVTLAMFSFAGSSIALQSQPENYRADYSRCIDDANNRGLNGNAGLEACTEGVTAAAKREMNLLYKQIYVALQARDSTEAAAFEKSQRLWLEYRNAHCDLEGKYIGGPETLICPMDLNIERVEKLRRLATGV